MEDEVAVRRRRLVLAVRALALASLGACALPSSTRETPPGHDPSPPTPSARRARPASTMPTTVTDDLTSRAAALLDLADAEYFTFDAQRSAELELALGGLVSADPADSAVALPVLALGAPSRVEAAERRNVPVLVGRVWTGMNAWQVNPKTNFVLLARHRTRGTLDVVTPFYRPRRGSQELRSGVGTPPEPFDAETLHSAVTSVDLGAAIQISAGNYAITGLLANRSTPTVHVEIEGPGSPVVAPSLTPDVRPLSQGTAATSDTVELHVQGRNQNPVLHVRHTVHDARDLQNVETGAPRFTCHVVLTRLDEAAIVLPLVVPATPLQPQGDELEPRHQVAFEVDLGPSLAAKGVETGAYQAYVDVSGEVRGPFPLDVEGDD